MKTFMRKGYVRAAVLFGSMTALLYAAGAPKFGRR